MMQILMRLDNMMSAIRDPERKENAVALALAGLGLDQRLANSTFYDVWGVRSIKDLFAARFSQPQPSHDFGLLKLSADGLRYEQKKLRLKNPDILEADLSPDTIRTRYEAAFVERRQMFWEPAFVRWYQYADEKVDTARERLEKEINQAQEFFESDKVDFIAAGLIRVGIEVKEVTSFENPNYLVGLAAQVDAQIVQRGLEGLRPPPETRWIVRDGAKARPFKAPERNATNKGLIRDVGGKQLLPKDVFGAECLEVIEAVTGNIRQSTLRLIKRVGEGTFGKIYKVCLPNNDCSWVVKVQKAGSEDDSGAMMPSEKRIRQEIAASYFASELAMSPKVVAFWKCRLGHGFGWFYLMRYLPFKSLFKCGARLSSETKQKMGGQLMHRLRRFHASRWVHDDLHHHEGNFLIDEKKGRAWVIDFSWATQLTGSEKKSDSPGEWARWLKTWYNNKKMAIDSGTGFDANKWAEKGIIAQGATLTEAEVRDIASVYFWFDLERMHHLPLPAADVVMHNKASIAEFRQKYARAANEQLARSWLPQLARLQRLFAANASDRHLETTIRDIHERLSGAIDSIWDDQSVQEHTPDAIVRGLRILGLIVPEIAENPQTFLNAWQNEYSPERFWQHVETDIKHLRAPTANNFRAWSVDNTTGSISNPMALVAPDELTPEIVMILSGNQKPDLENTLKLSLAIECLTFMQETMDRPLITRLHIQRYLSDGMNADAYVVCIDNDCKYVLKIMTPDSVDVERSLMLEARAGIAAHGIGLGPRVYGFWECLRFEDGSPKWALLMAFIPGKLLAKSARTRPEGIRLLEKVMVFHSLGWTHNDTHDENIIVEHDAKDQPFRAWLIDYGRAEFDRQPVRDMKPDAAWVEAGLMKASVQLSLTERTELATIIDEYELLRQEEAPKSAKRQRSKDGGSGRGDGHKRAKAA